MALRKGFVLILSAPSGAGKSTLARFLLESLSGVRVSVSTTTRAPRPGERHGEHYHFVDRATFDTLRQQGEFLEWAEVFGNAYGTSRGVVRESLERGEDVLLDIDWQGARQVRGNLNPSEVVSIFILPPSHRVLKERLEGRRTDAPEVIEGRMARARDEISHWNEYDYLLVNDDLEVAQEQLAAIVRAERLRRSRAGLWLDELLQGFELPS